MEQPNLTCTADERESVLPSTLAITQLVFLDEADDKDLTTTAGLVCCRVLKK